MLYLAQGFKLARAGGHKVKQMQDLNGLEQDILQRIARADDLKALDDVRVAAVGKNGVLSGYMKELGTLMGDARKSRGQALNLVQQQIMQALQDRKDVLSQAALDLRLATETQDVTLDAPSPVWGKIHPCSQTLHEAVTIFQSMGFAVAQGPEIEDDFHNFTALNVPPHHPARQEQDTFYLPPDHERIGMLLRTQTSPVQIRALETHKPPIRIIAPGRVYRSDYDATHTPVFHQIEGLVIEEKIHMGHLKGCLVSFLKRFFCVESLPMRYRPSYFPFTEPSAEVDIACRRDKGELIVGEGEDWLEILGCGMVHPQVLINAGLDPEVHQGFAFGIGVERITMLKYGIPDLRAFYENDKRWMNHYGFSFAQGLNGETLS